MKTNGIKMCFVAAAVALMGAGCDNAPAATTDAPAPGADKVKVGGVKVAKEGGAKSAATPAPKKSNNFAITADAVNVAVGADGKANISVKPGSGFKINVDYPWKATIADAAGLEMGTKEFAKDTWTLSEKDAALAVPLKASAAGESTVKAKLNFSICNDARCDVVRDHEVTWKVAAK